MEKKPSAEKDVREIRRKTRRRFAIVLPGPLAQLVEQTERNQVIRIRLGSAGGWGKPTALG